MVFFGIMGFIIIRSSKPKPPAVGESFPILTSAHISVGASHVPYNSNPPTSGPHYASPATPRFYDQELPDEQLVHNLEHSHVWIAYKPNLPIKQIEMLADIAKGYGSRLIMAPRSANDTPIALMAWEHLLKMDSVDEKLVKEFIEAYRGTAGPEKIPDSGFKDFRK